MNNHRGYVNLHSYKMTENSEEMKKKTKEEYTLEDRTKDSEAFIMFCAKQVEEKR